ncbi:class I SAM-dependent methyltransferase [Acidovorax sp. LjRoot118]|uniref:class I SAM-dependent rRNA methyltransferase n=1 Tax=unclassified Acidovorax TaxID=2684926 RepID=UPI000710F732|nr:MULTISPECIES: class I SAM-dependent methyltransferase [unclassified Acidovorax]KRC28105.1 23S rRNA methyltransferase [Acidovorax sp. Root217]KRC30153.1 23S rRNA methyltransferase [Acidovorax sp. Root219]
MKTLRLRPGKERSLLRRHPWIFESAIAKGGGDSGETVRVESHEGQFLAWAAFSPSSRIRARVWSFDEAQRIDEPFFIAACARAIIARARFDVQSDGIRLVHGESDGLPGLIVDRYGDTLVAQFTSAGTERWKDVLADALLRETGLTRLYERSDASVRALEGLEPATGWLRGGPVAGGEVPPVELTIHEHQWQLTLNIAEGHKTGFYLDQRDSRKRFADYARRLGFQHVLNCFCYTGGFSVAALAGMRAAEAAGGPGGGHVTSIDSSGPALERARAHVALNGFDVNRASFLDADVNASLRQFLKEGQRFDAIVLDPPKFAPTAAHAERAARAYKDINRLALQLLTPGGVLFTFSCSGGISADLFHKIVASAGADAGVDGYIVERLAGAPDHPMTLEFPEGEYLKGLVVMRKS